MPTCISCCFVRGLTAGEEQSVVGETIKLLVLASTLAAAQGQAAQEGVMQVGA